MVEKTESEAWKEVDHQLTKDHRDHFHKAVKKSLMIRFYIGVILVVFFVIITILGNAPIYVTIFFAVVGFFALLIAWEYIQGRLLYPIDRYVKRKYGQSESSNNDQEES